MPFRSPVRVAIAALALGALGACAGPTTSLRYDQVHQTAVETAPIMLEAPADRPLGADDAARVAAFGRAFLGSGATEITIAYPADIPSRPAVESMKHALMRVGVEDSRIVEGAYARDVDGDRGVVASYYAPTAEAAACPGIAGDTTRDVFNRTPLWFGCSTNANLAAMIERPRDLVTPRASTPASAQRRVQVISDYQTGSVTASEEGAEATETTN